jgi:hypothetical protein
MKGKYKSYGTKMIRFIKNKVVIIYFILSTSAFDLIFEEAILVLVFFYLLIS